MALEKIAKYNTCCRKKQAEVEPETDDANVTTVTESVTPVKPKRKSRISDVDHSDINNMEEAENLLTTSLDSNDDKITPGVDPSGKKYPLRKKTRMHDSFDFAENHFLPASELALERRISNTECQLELDMPRDEVKEETETLPLPSAPPSPIEKNSRLSESSEGNQEVLPDAVDEIVELRTTGRVQVNREENGSEDVERKSAEGSSSNQTFAQLLEPPKLRRNFIVMIFVWWVWAIDQLLTDHFNRKIQQFISTGSASLSPITPARYIYRN